MKKERNKKEEKKNVSREEISEIFEIENGKEETIRTHKTIEKKEKEPSKRELKKENKIFRNVIIVMIGFLLVFFAGYAMIYFSNHFEVEGIKFETTRMGELMLYKTSIPGIINQSGTFIMGKNGFGAKAEYNIYFRKDPRQLEKIPFDGGIVDVKKFNAINLTDSFNCNGDGIIAIANLLTLYDVIGGSIVKDENANCDPEGMYGWIQIEEGDETSIDRFGPACFNLYVDNCEILDVTERFMLETLTKLNENGII